VNVDELLLPDGEAGVAVPLFVTAEVATGFVVVQVRVPLVQLLAPIAIVQVDEVGVRVPDIVPAVAVNVPSGEYPVPVVFVA